MKSCGNEKERVCMNLRKDLLNKLDNYAQGKGTSRTAIVSIILSEAMENVDVKAIK